MILSLKNPQNRFTSKLHWKKKKMINYTGLFSKNSVLLMRVSTHMILQGHHQHTISKYTLLSCNSGNWGPYAEKQETYFLNYT